MERDEAMRRLLQLKAQDVNLHDLASKLGVTVTLHGKQNKGWAGHVFERYLGLPLNSAKSPNFGSWELKSTSVKYLKSGKLVFKETMCIAMLDNFYVKNTPFEESHLLDKLHKMIVVTRTVGAHYLEPSFVYSVTTVDLAEDVYEDIRADYNLVRECLNDPAKGFSQLRSTMGEFMQSRTKGKGHGSKSRAFYVRGKFLERVIDLKNPDG